MNKKIYMLKNKQTNKRLLGFCWYCFFNTPEH